MFPVFLVLHQFHRYRTLKNEESMGRERKYFYQLKKAVGEGMWPEADLTMAEGVGAAVEAASKRRKRKTKRAHSTSEVELDEEDSRVPETAEIPKEVDATLAKKRTAQEEVNLKLLF